jgi:hypothetical protein
VRFSPAILGALFLTPVLVTATHAEHEVFHRYVILGYVKDGKGAPLARVPVHVVRTKTGLAYNEPSDQDGFYVVIVHLHDEDLGDSLVVTAQGVSAKVTAAFNPKDETSERGTRLDFQGKRTEERRSWFLPTLRQYLSK